MKTRKDNADMDESNDGVSYEMGREFEWRFADFLRNELGWENVRVGAHMPGRHNAKGASIDVLGERLDALGVRYRGIANKWMAASALLIMSAMVWYSEDWGSDGLWFAILSIASFAGGLSFRLLSGANNRQHCWAECKNLKGKANVNHVAKMLREHGDFKSSGAGGRRFTHLYFASANGYVENALKMAMDNGVLCYQWNGKSFEEVGYWAKNTAKK